MFALLGLCACEAERKNKRSSLSKSYGQVFDIVSFSGKKSAGNGVSLAGSNSIITCLAKAGMTDDEPSAQEAAANVDKNSALDNMVAVLDQGLGCAIEAKLSADDFSGFFNVIVDYFSSAPRSRLETMEAMTRFNEILVRYLADLEDSEVIKEILIQTIEDNLSSYSDAGAELSYSDIAANISETAGAAFTAQTLSASDAIDILSSLGKAAATLAVSVNENPAMSADIFSDVLKAYFSGVGSITSENFADVSNAVNALASSYGATYGANLSTSDGTIFHAEAKENIDTVMADLLAAGKISSSDAASLKASIKNSVTSVPLTPSLSPSTQNFTAAFDVTASENATTDPNFLHFRYTTTGTAPTDCSDGNSSSGTINISGTSSVTLNVIACDSDGNASSTATGTYTYTGAPSAVPSISTFSSLATTSLTLNWNDVSNETGYVIERATYSGGACGAYSAIANSPTAANATTVNDSGLTAGTPYCYKIKATGSVADSDFASASLVITNVAAPTINSEGTSSIGVNWNTVAGLTYTLYRSTSSSSVSTSDTSLSSSATPVHNDATVSCGSSHYYAVLPVLAGAYAEVSAGSSAGLCKAATPAISPAAGSYSSAQSISVTSATSSATLCYSTSGSPSCTAASCTTGSTFSSAFTQSSSATVAAIACKSGYSNSDAASNAYTITQSWAQQAFLKAANAEATDYFGYAVFISGDTAIVGAYSEDSNQTSITNGTTASATNSSSASGAAYIFKRSGSSWAQEAYLKAPNPDASDNFGKYVALSGDTAIVGAPAEDSLVTTITNGTTASTDNIATDAGAAYIFKRTGTTWAQEAFLKAYNANSNDNFGSAVAISSDTAIVGATGEDSNQTIITNGTTASSNNGSSAAGAAYIYKLSGSTWAQEAYVKAANADANDWYGASVAISNDTAIIGSMYECSNETTITNGTTASPNNSASYPGAAYIYKRTSSTWAQEAYVKAPNPDNNDYYGWSVAIDADTAMVGALSEASNQTIITNGTTASSNNSAASAGAAYIYKRTGSTWAQEAFLKASNAEGGDSFGHSVSISGDTAVVGAKAESSNQTTITNGTTSSSNNSTNQSGAVYVYNRTGATWVQQAYIKAANAAASDRFGYSVGISSDYILVGAYDEDSNDTTITNGTTASSNNSASGAGAAYIYLRQ